MSAVRTSVEWGYGKIVKYFAFLDFSKNLKVLLQPVGIKLYIVAALLANCHTCLNMAHRQANFLIWILQNLKHI